MPSTIAAATAAARGPEPPSEAVVVDTASMVTGAMPKDEIGATRFLKDNPTADGRGVVLAVLDTGVDPGAAGLAVCPDGSPKIIDIVDCTGSGDVDTSLIRKADEAGTIEAASGGKRLALNPDWTNPSGDWHVGCIRAYALFPSGLKSRITDARAKEDAVKVRKAAAAARADAADTDAGKGAYAGLSGRAARKAREEAAARLALLTSSDLAGGSDPGPMIEAVVWHDGHKLVAALDTSALLPDEEAAAAEPRPPGRPPPAAAPARARPQTCSGARTNPPRSGALADFTPMTNYRDCLQFATLSARDALNFVFNIYGPNLLSIVTDSGAHGTHVAGIAAAYHPDAPELNGVAPAARLISARIGDVRVSGMETVVGVARALSHALAAGADVANMSFGEPAADNAGLIMDLAAEAVNKGGLIYVSSAGNAGPALGTVGAPGGTSSAVISVGAYVSPAMAAAAHSSRVAPPASGAQYTWSSRGPTFDGHVGVTVSAPGGAVAPVPTHTRQASQLMNGTSMASPNAAGAIALLVSAGKQQLAAAGAPPGARPSPARVRRAIENTALPLGGGAPDAPLTYGRGLIQVDAAAAYLAKELAADPPDCSYEVSVRRSDGHGGGPMRGLVIRDAGTAPVSASVTVTPTLHEAADVAADFLAIDDRLTLSCTQPWLSAPSTLMLPAGGRSFEVVVETAGLAEGLHTGEVVLTDARSPWRGALARVPVTVLKPATVDTSAAAGGGVVDLGTVAFAPGTEARRFVSPPPGATWAVLRVKAGPGADPPRGFMLRLTQALPHTRYTESEARTYVSLGALSEATLSAQVAGGEALEITAAQFWSSAGESQLSLSISFHGVQASPSALSLLPGQVGKLLITAPFRRETVRPSAKLTGLRWSLRPSSSTIAPLSAPRDALPSGGRVSHALTLSYTFDAAEAGDYRVGLPALSGYLYDSPAEAQMSIAYADKRVLGVSDVYPAKLTFPKGAVTIRTLVRHHDAAILSGLADAPLSVERSLGDGLALPVHTTHAAAVLAAAKAGGNNGGKKGEAGGGDGAGGPASTAAAPTGAWKERALTPGERAAVFVGPLPDSKLPKDASPGSVLVGALTLGRKAMVDGGGDAPGGVPISLVVGPAPSKKKDDKKDEDDEEEEGKKDGQADKRAKAVLDAEVEFLKGLKPGSSEDAAAEAEALLADALARHADHLPLLRARVSVLSSLEGDVRASRRDAIVAAADAVVAAVDTRALADAAARKTPDDAPGAATRAKDRGEQSAALTEALTAKAQALLDLDRPDAFTAAVDALKAWADATDPKAARLFAEAEAAAGRPALAIQLLDKAIGAAKDKPPAKDLLERRVALLRECGWAWAADAAEDRLRDAFPPGYAPF